MSPSPLLAVSRRLIESDMMQLLVGYLALLSFVLIVSWPSASQQANDSWYALSQTKMLAIMLMSLAYGSAAQHAEAWPKAVTLAAILCLVFFSLPLDVGSYAAGFPAVPLSWALAIVPLNVVAYFGLGILLGHLCRAARLDFLLPLIVPAVIAGVFMFDIWLGTAILNPFSAVTTVAPLHLAAMGLLSLLCAILLLRGAATRRKLLREDTSKA